MLVLDVQGILIIFNKSASITLKQGVEKMLVHYVEEVTEVIGEEETQNFWIYFFSYCTLL